MLKNKINEHFIIARIPVPRSVRKKRGEKDKPYPNP